MKYLLQKCGDTALVNREIMQRIASKFSENYHSENTLYILDDGVYYQIKAIYLLPNKCILHTTNKFYEHINIYTQLVNWEVVIKGNKEC